MHGFAGFGTLRRLPLNPDRVGKRASVHGTLAALGDPVRLGGTRMTSDHSLPSPLDAVGRILRAHPKVERQLNRAAAPFENLSKTFLFSCNMCGNCVLHETGMTCPMNCPKQLRNGPCGGVRMDGHCEVRPEMECVWLKAERRSRRLPWRAAFLRYRYPIDWRLRGTSGILNFIVGRPEHNGREPR